MKASTRTWIYAGLLLAMLPISTSAFQLTWAAHFNQWYPQWKDRFDSALRNNCSAEYDDYANSPPVPGHPEHWAAQLIKCLLSSDWVDEGMKANMASACVLLGFLPAILATVGSTTTETALLGLRRPLLAFLLTLGSPAPSALRAFEYADPKEFLEERKGAHIWTWRNLAKSRMASLYVGLEFFLALAASANSVELALELGYCTISNFASSQTWIILLWTILGILVHVFGSWALRLQVEVDRSRKSDRRVLRSPVAAWLRNEFTLCATHSKTALTMKDETAGFIFVSWLTATGTAVHLLYGILMFSSLTFISVQDATIVVARYFVAALVCRAMVMFELKGMRQASEIRKDSSAVELLPQPQLDQSTD